MIFKRGKRGSGDQEPQTKSDIFEPSEKKATSPNPLAARSPDQQDILPSEEPPTRDAIFNDAPVAAQSEPPTGWAAVIAGPEKGRIIALGYGETLIELADPVTAHRLNYDPVSREFSLCSKGEDNNDVIRPLGNRETFKIGGQTFLLIPLCADGFDWRTS